LSKKKLLIDDCPRDSDPKGVLICEGIPKVAVRINATDPENDDLTYSYTVSAGRIEGMGAEVVWNLTGTRVGTYTITVIVDDGDRGRSVTKTESVDIGICYDSCKKICDCPQLVVNGPASAVEPGESLAFTTHLLGGNQKNLTYAWEIDRGKIISGQGTPRIIVDTNGLEDVTVTATVTVKGDSECDCTLTGTESGVVIAPPKPRRVERLINPNCEYHMMIMDSFFNDLQNEPTAKGYIVFYGSARAVATKERQTRSYMRLRSMNPSRIVFVNGGVAQMLNMEFWIVPAGADSDLIWSDSYYVDIPDSKETKKVPEPEPIDKTKPYVFSEEYYDGVVCYGEVDKMDLAGYAEILKENPKSRGNIVITLMTKKEYREKRKEILEFLTGQGIAGKRLRTFHVKGYGGVELWYLPANWKKEVN
jgi:hypothetical protein